GRRGQLVVETGRAPLPSPLGEGGAEVLESILAEQRAVQLQHLALGGNLQVTALAGDDLVRALHPVPRNEAGLAIEPRVADRPEPDALAGHDHFGPLDEEAVEEQAEAESHAAAHRNGEGREG